MDRQTTDILFAKGYSRYVVNQHKTINNTTLDAATKKMPWEFIMDDWATAVAKGQKPLECWIAKEDGNFVVYLPPRDDNFGINGFCPSQEVAEKEFKRFVEKEVIP